MNFLTELKRRNVIRMAGVPAHRRGAILFRNLLKRMNLTE